MTHLSWVALQGKAHSYRQGCYPCGFVFCDCGFNSVCLLMDEELWNASWEGLAVGKTGSYSGQQGYAQ